MKCLAQPVLVVAVLAMACGAGCKEEELQQQVEQQREIIRSLQNENGRLKQETDGLRSQLSATQQAKTSIETERAALESKLRGAGVNVGVREGRLAVILPSKIFFNPGKASLSRKGFGALRKIAKVLNSDVAGKVIRVEGHTDNTPIRKSGYKSNLELSNHRAETVWHYLVEHGGINPRKIYTAGFAQYRPIASNKTASGRQQNRRVELVVIQE
ncbi:MAG: flagellar motor protein MotB [Planctomycetes bacterium]|nr:flagellar motor protein MotB [Planctomycetota bacterium]